MMSGRGGRNCRKARPKEVEPERIRINICDLPNELLVIILSNCIPNFKEGIRSIKEIRLVNKQFNEVAPEVVENFVRKLRGEDGSFSVFTRNLLNIEMRFGKVKFSKSWWALIWLATTFEATRGKPGKLSTYWYWLRYKGTLARHYRREIGHVSNLEFDKMKDGLWNLVTSTERKHLRNEMVSSKIMFKFLDKNYRTFLGIRFNPRYTWEYDYIIHVMKPRY